MDATLYPVLSSATLNEKLEEQPLKENPTLQDRWDRIAKVNNEAAKEVLGFKTKKKMKSENPEIVKLSKQQLHLRNKINNTKNKEKRIKLKSERNSLINKIHKLKT